MGFTGCLLLCAIFGFIFIILQLEDFALLAGSIGLLVVLASVMYYSRNIDWDNLGKVGAGSEIETVS